MEQAAIDAAYAAHVLLRVLIANLVADEDREASVHASWRASRLASGPGSSLRALFASKLRVSKWGP